MAGSSNIKMLEVKERDLTNLLTYYSMKLTNALDYSYYFYGQQGMSHTIIKWHRHPEH